MKQKIVLEVYMPCDKSRKKARKITALTEGMIMATDTDRNQLEVIGEGIDTAFLATTLRKKVGRTAIISVEEVKSDEKETEAEDKKENKDGAKKKKKEDDDEEEAAKNRKCVPWKYNQIYNYPPPPYPGYEVRYGVSCFPNTWFSW